MMITTITPIAVLVATKEEEGFQISVLRTAAIGLLMLEWVSTYARLNGYTRDKKPLSVAALAGYAPDGLRPCLDATELMEAAYEGNLQEIYRLQENGAFLDEKDPMGKTAMHWAAIGQQRAALELLWYLGGDLYALDQHRLSPIHYLSPGTDLYAACDALFDRRNRFQLPQPIYPFYPPENLVLKGGGAKGLAFVGAIRCLEEQGLLGNVRRVAGTSAGAIAALLTALGYRASEQHQLLVETDLRTFLDHPYASEQEMGAGVIALVCNKWDTSIDEAWSLIQNAWNYYSENRRPASLVHSLKDMIEAGGLCKGDKILAWFETLIERRTGISHCTFREYREWMERAEGNPRPKHLYVYASRLDPSEVVCLNSEESRWNDVVISSAIRASMSIPGVFQPATLLMKRPGEAPRPDPMYGAFVDGGMVRNFPIQRFDYERYLSSNPPSWTGRMNPQTLALNLTDPPSSAPPPAPGDPQNRPDMWGVGQSVLRFYAENEEIVLRDHPTEHPERIIHINNQGVGTVAGFFAPLRTKMQLVRSGYNAICQFLQTQEQLAQRHRQHDPRELSLFRNRFIRRAPPIEMPEEKEPERHAPPAPPPARPQEAVHPSAAPPPARPEAPPPPAPAFLPARPDAQARLSRRALIIAQVKEEIQRNRKEAQEKTHTFQP
jgi:NTE family protein